MRPVATDTLLTDIYVKLCTMFHEDTYLSRFSDRFLFDFMPVANPTRTPTQYRDKPRLSVLPTNITYARDTTCNNNLTINYEIVLEGFQLRDIIRPQVEWRIMYLLRNLPFTSMLIDNTEYPVIAEPEQGSWDFDSERQTLTFRVSVGIQTRF